jgi:hypothetical protein
VDAIGRRFCELQAAGCRLQVRGCAAKMSQLLVTELSSAAVGDLVTALGERDPIFLQIHSSSDIFYERHR